LFGLKKARNVVELAALIGCSSATLEATLAASAAAKRGEQPDAFGRDQEDIHDLEAPYYLMDISLDAKLLPCTVLTMGGLVVDEATGAVIREDGKAIGGLYAAGRTAVGVPSHLYMSGLSIADGIFSGRRAAKAIAEG
jgi:3-oxo-5alpha-steroid 4-dehydrogenase